MSEEIKKELKENKLSEEQVEQVSGGSEVWDTCGKKCCACPLGSYKWECPYCYG